MRTDDDVPAMADHLVALVRDQVVPWLRSGPGAVDPSDGRVGQRRLLVAVLHVSDEPVVGRCRPGRRFLTGPPRPGPWGRAERKLHARATATLLTWDEARLVLRLSRRRLEQVADAVGATEFLTFVDLLVISLVTGDHPLGRRTG